MRIKKKLKKKKLIIVLSIIIFIIMIGLISFLLINDKPKKIEKKSIKKENIKIEYVDNLEFEINSEVHLLDIIKNIENGSLVDENILIDTKSLGNLKVTYKVKNNKNKEKEYDIDINIIDTTKPEIESKDNITIYIGNNINLKKDVLVSDNSNEFIEVEVEGSYDINKEGEYNLEYVAKDSSGNETRKKVILKVIKNPNNNSFKTSKGYIGKNIDGVTYIDGILIVNKTYSLPSNYGNGLTSETQNAFNKMKEDASKSGLNIWLSSGFRSYNSQNTIYNNYVAKDGKEKADTYSARAGHSEHQTGLAFDLNTIDDTFSYTEEGIWVANNCYKYGLILRYPKGKETITGYMYESWHLRYVGVDLATKLYNDGNWITLEEYFGIDSKYQ